MATSLAQQLHKLSVPQSAIYKEERKKASLLFDPKEAAHKDRDTFYEIGLSGLHELIALYEGFRIYEDTLFSLSSKDFERAVQSKEVNKNLDQTIEKFLTLLSPYMLLQSSYKALEWLVNRYHIHEYNQDAIMALILPYHETKIFVRFVQILDVRSPSNNWQWLKPVQNSGFSLAKQTLYNQCASKTNTLQFIATSTAKYVKQFGERATQLNTVYAFFCSTAIGTMSIRRKVNEAIINALLPTLMNALNSPIDDFRSSGYVVLGYLMTKAHFKERTINDIIEKLTSEFDFSYDMTLLVNLIYTNQNHITKTPLYNISVDTMNTLCDHLKKLTMENINITPFIVVFLSSVLPVVQNNTEDFKTFKQLPEILLDEVDLYNQEPEKIVKCIISAFQEHNEETSDGNESDIEIIDDFSYKILEWYSEFMKNVEKKYSEAFDKVIKSELSNENSSGRRDHLTKILGFNPAVARKISGKYLFENLNHVNPEIRVEAVNYIAKDFESLKKENIDFVKESIINRLNDDNVNVVSAALAIHTEYLEQILDEHDLANALVNIISNESKHWRIVVKDAVKKFCALEKFPVNHNTVLSLVPYLFPNDVASADLAFTIIHSPWGEKLRLMKGFNKSQRDNSQVINSLTFKALFLDKNVTFDEILDINQLNKSKTRDICLYLLLQSCCFEKRSAYELSDFLTLLLESVEEREIIHSSEGESFSSEIMSEFIKRSQQGKIVFEVIEYILSRIVENMKTCAIEKPWCDVCQSSEIVLIRRLYEIFLTGCSICSYSDNYKVLLQKLFNKLFSNAKEKFEFVANFACGHILYATDPKNVISPELQLRSIKLMTNFFSVQESADWIYKSDVLILTILFCLNNPIAVIRQSIIDLMKSFLKYEPEENYTYVKLIKAFVSSEEELLLDHEQIPQILATILTNEDPVTKKFRKETVLKLTGILINDIPAHIISKFLEILNFVNNSNVYTYIVPSLHKLETRLQQNELDKNLTFNIYESKLFRNVYSRINEKIASTFEKEEVWNSIKIGLKEYRECILEEDETFVSPAVLIMRQIDDNIFKRISEEKHIEIIEYITSAGTFSNNPAIATVASKVMKRIHIKLSDFKSILNAMINAENTAQNTRKKKNSSISMLSHEVMETNEWRLGVTLLEYVQNKKKMIVDNNFVSLLFAVLSKCLRFEDQSYVEYTKQLVLSSVWFYCKKFIDTTRRDQVASLKSVFNIELVVQCIRGTQNPQTHHHALILLSHAAHMLPDQVLHHTMEIFTFMGSSVLRHDDAYSFQIITRIIETIVPIVVKDNKNRKNDESECQSSSVVPVLRIFADVVLHVPEHRRLPLYKKFIEILGTNYLWMFIAVLFEGHIRHWNENKEKDKRSNRRLADQESPMNRLDFAQSIILEFSPEICLLTFLRLLNYMKSLPTHKKENEMDTNVDPNDIFSINGHSAVQLRHYKYIIITFMNTCLSSARYIQHICQANNENDMKNYLKDYIISILTYIQNVSKIKDEKTAKYWRVMLHHSYDLLDHTNNLLSTPVFLCVIRGLMTHTLQAVRRKSMELLNTKIQFVPDTVSDVDKELILSLLPVLLDVVKTVEVNDESLGDTAIQELELNQQTALLSLKLLTRLLASEHPEHFKPILETITEYTCNLKISGNVMASVVLCLAELCTNLKAHALTSLRKFMPALIKLLKKQRKAETPELILLSTVMAISKIVESLPLFLSPYLQKILYEYSILLAKWQAGDQECSKVSSIVSKLSHIKEKIASLIPPRVLIPVANEAHKQLLEKDNFEAIGPLMLVLADSFSNVTTADFTALEQELTVFFLSALQLRSDAVERNVPNDVIDTAEDEVVNALVSLVLKLSETKFRPFYFKIYDWAIRANDGSQKDRVITFYRLSSAIADKLKGLFVLFAGDLIKNAAKLLDACNNSKSEELYFETNEKCIVLITYIIKTVHTVCLYDSQNFLNKDRFETLMQPVVDQLENTLGGVLQLKDRAKDLLIPCISQFAVATADDSLWKLLNYQILLKTRHNDAEIRLVSLDCLVAMATQLGSSWLPLLAESVPFLAELLEDGDPKIESSTKEAIRKLEEILGEPLEKYF